MSGEPPLGSRVTIENLDTGEIQTKVFMPGEYFLITYAPCYVDTTTSYANGTVQITIKSNQPRGAHGQR